MIDKTGQVPKKWKEANIMPIFKKGSKLERANYRPVSLTSTMSKILASIIRDKIMNYLKLKRFISSSQNGFVPNKTCVTNLLETSDIKTDEVNKGHSVDSVALDFAKAFDKLPRKKLVQKT